MPAALSLLAVTVVLLAAPASAQDHGQGAETGFPVALVVLAVVATVFALVWRAVSKRKQQQRR